jgi:hypothetical protein
MKIYEIAKDGLPDIDSLTGRVAFIWDGNIVSGWPLFEIHLKYPQNNYPIYTINQWEANEDVGRKGVFDGVEKYIVFDVPVWDL